MVKLEYDWFGEHTGLSLLGPELESGANVWGASHHGPSPDFSGLMAAEVRV